MNYQFVTVAAADHILTATINRPDQRNALHPAANHELGRVFDDFEADPSLWVAIVTGAGEKAFCAGADLKAIPKSNTPFVPPTGFAGMTHRFDRRKPVIAAVNGSAFGGGLELALACDIIVAAESAKFGLTEPRVGLVALAGGVQRLVREIGLKRASGMLMTARHVSAREALDLGFVNEVVPDMELRGAARRWADEILKCSPAALRATKEIIEQFDGKSIRGSIETMFDLPSVKAAMTGPDAKEGPQAFAERRLPRWNTG